MLASENSNSLELLKTLADDCSRKILLSIISKSSLIEEISQEQHNPIKSCYKRARNLETSDMIRKDETSSTGDRKKLVRYSSTFKNATIELD